MKQPSHTCQHTPSHTCHPPAETLQNSASFYHQHSLIMGQKWILNCCGWSVDIEMHQISKTANAPSPSDFLLSRLALRSTAHRQPIHSACSSACVPLRRLGRVPLQLPSCAVLGKHTANQHCSAGQSRLHIPSANCHRLRPTTSVCSVCSAVRAPLHFGNATSCCRNTAGGTHLH